MGVHRSLPLVSGHRLDIAQNDGGTPLYICAEKGLTRLATALLDSGAQVDLARVRALLLTVRALL